MLRLCVSFGDTSSLEAVNPFRASSHGLGFTARRLSKQSRPITHSTGHHLSIVQDRKGYCSKGTSLVVVTRWLIIPKAVIPKFIILKGEVIPEVIMVISEALSSFRIRSPESRPMSVLVGWTRSDHSQLQALHRSHYKLSEHTPNCHPQMLCLLHRCRKAT